MRTRRASRTRWSLIDSKNSLSGETRHLGFAGAMLEELFCRYSSDRRAATVALIRVLPEVKPADEHLFTTHQRALLRAILRRGEPQLISAALVALARIGDNRDLDEVRIAQSNAHDDRIRDLASICGAAIEDRIVIERSRDMLLRPSQATPIPTLLRAASGSSDSPPNELLRPTDGE